MDPGLLAAVIGADRLTRRQALARIAQLLGGGALSGSILAGLAACERGAEPAPGAFDGEQRELLAALVDHVVPETDTPGAREVGVPAFIEVVWSECLSPEEREIFNAGLDDVDQRTRHAHGRRFTECSPEQQQALLEEIDREAFAPPPPPRPRPADRRPSGEPHPVAPAAPPGTEWVWGEPWRTRAPAAPFWRTVKRLTLVGYYTSQAGATEELRYEPVPGGFEGCVPLAQVGRAWAV